MSPEYFSMLCPYCGGDIKCVDNVIAPHSSETRKLDGWWLRENTPKAHKEEMRRAFMQEEKMGRLHLKNKQGKKCDDWKEYANRT